MATILRPNHSPRLYALQARGARAAIALTSGACKARGEQAAGDDAAASERGTAVKDQGAVRNLLAAISPRMRVAIELTLRHVTGREHETSPAAIQGAGTDRGTRWLAKRNRAALTRAGGQGDIGLRTRNKCAERADGALTAKNSIGRSGGTSDGPIKPVRLAGEN